MKMIYLDNASTTKPDDNVVYKMIPWMSYCYGNPGARYDLGRDALDAIEEARAHVADLIGASPWNIIFTSGGSEANNMVMNAYDYIVTSSIEHDSILHRAEAAPQKFPRFARPVRTEHGYKITKRSVEKALHLAFNNNKSNKSLYGNTLVSVMYMNNETGITNDVGDIAKLCHENGISFHTDCVQALGCTEVDVDKIGCDFLSMSAHKIHGPKGIGALYVRDVEKFKKRPHLIYGGGEQEFGLRGGTQNVAGIVGFGEACRVSNERLYDTIENDKKYRNAIVDRIMEEMSKRNDDCAVHVNCGLCRDDDGKTVSVCFDGIDGETLLLMLAEDGVCVSAGSACKSHEQEPSKVLLECGVSEEDARCSLRFSVSSNTTMQDINMAAYIIANDVHKLRTLTV